MDEPKYIHVYGRNCRMATPHNYMPKTQYTVYCKGCRMYLPKGEFVYSDGFPVT